jgi:hypothetical protein
VHVTSEHLGPWPLEAKAALLSIATPAAALVARSVLDVHSFVSTVSLTTCYWLEASFEVARPEAR